MKHKLICSVCKTEPHSDDAGFGILFEEGDQILCKKKRSYGETFCLHYHDLEQLHQAIIDTANGENDDARAVRSTTSRKGIVLLK